MFPREAMARIGDVGWSIFYASQGGTLDYGVQSWTKPRGIKFVYFFAIGAGSGGGSPTDGTRTTGAGGGCSGAVYTAFFPAIMVPDTVYVRVGKGGAGGAGGSDGTAGEQTTIDFVPDPNLGATVINLTSGDAGRGGAGNAGAVALNNIITPGYPTGMSLTQGADFTGDNGASGASSTNGTGASRTWGGSGLFLTGGGGGGNGTGSGGAISVTSLDIPTVSGGVGTTGGNGANGFGYGKRIALSPYTINPLPLLSFTGGSGGGGHTTGQAGNGGNGAYGCGGGGGGGATNFAGLGGRGGNGGNGLVIIGAF